ncbi:MAG: GDSL-type esterase/lipase family protein [Myxococcota bacterium]
MQGRTPGRNERHARRSPGAGGGESIRCATLWVMASLRSRARRQALRIAGGLLIAVLVLEVGLQLASLAMRGDGPSERADAARVSAGEYRILCLGESTTEGFGETSYPELLQQELDRSHLGPSFRVINAGFSGVHSIALANRLPELIRTHEPQMVIAMVGINDPFYFEETETLALPVEVQVVLLRSRVYKLVRLLALNLRQQLSGGARAERIRDAEHWADYSRRHQDAWQRWVRGERDDHEVRLRGLIAMARDAGRTTDGEVAGAIDLPDAYLHSYFDNHLALSRIYLTSGRGAEAVALYEAALEFHPHIEFFHRALSELHRTLDQPELAERHRAAARAMAGRQVFGITRDSLNRMGSLLEEEGIVFVAMQYPLRSVDTLRFMLGGRAEAIYVENETVFRKAVAERGYNALFVDRVAGDFGHCSEEGNRLIAQNLVATVFEPMFSQEGKP